MHAFLKEERVKHIQTTKLIINESLGLYITDPKITDLLRQMNETTQYETGISFGW